MQANIPDSIAFVKPLIAKHNEIYKVEPIVGYFCLILAVQQVLDSQLHTKDTNVADFASQIMTTLEEMKKDPDLLNNETTIAILDSDEQSHDYVMRFAMSVFDRAELATLTAKVTKITAATFAAAAVFLSMESIWGPISDENKDKIKFSKFQAARILRAIKAGEDPNSLYEIPDDELEPASEEAAPGVDSVVEPGNESNSESNASGGDKNDKPEISNDEVDGNNTVSLPEAPKYNPENDITLPQAPHANPKDDITLPVAPKSVPEKPSGDTTSSKSVTSAPSPSNSPNLPPKVPSKPPAAPAKPASAQQPAQKQARKPIQTPAQIMELTKGTGQAQKHAKYAISALNYEDIKTAISELEKAIDVLRAFE